MKYTTAICMILLLTIPVLAAYSENHSTDALEAFLGTPEFAMQQLWEDRGGTSIITAQDGTIVAFRTFGHNTVRRSTDGGATWNADIEIGPNATGGNAIIDESNGDILYVEPEQSVLWRSVDHGATWSSPTKIEIRPDGFGLLPGEDAAGAMQPGITLTFGPHKGRLLI